MEVIDKEKFNRTKPLKEKKTKDNKISDKEFAELLEQMQNPIKAQQHLAVQVKSFLDKRINSEMNNQGFLSDNTRKWVKQFNEILDSIQKSLYGDKSTTINVHKVTHSAIATKMREAIKDK